MKTLIKLLIVSLAAITAVGSGDGLKAQEDKSYNTVQIGEQEWMAENLNVSHFKNGDPIPEARTEEDWYKAAEEKQPAWCYYDNDPENGNKYGKLYNWFAVNDSRGLAPGGWHVASDHEWKILEMALGVSQEMTDSEDEWRGTDEGDKLKVKRGWEERGNGTDKSGFSALPGGFRDDMAYFGYMGSKAYFWTSTDYLFVNEEYGYIPILTSFLRILSYDMSEVGRSVYFGALGGKTGYDDHSRPISIGDPNALVLWVLH